MTYLILNGIFASFNDHIYFDNSVFLLCCLWLKSFIMISKPIFKSCCTKSVVYLFFHRWLHAQHLLDILNLGFATDSEEDKYFSLYSCIHFIFGGFGLEKWFIIPCYCCRYITHAAVTNFYVFFIENFV